jgi:hypothetical protein
VGLVQLSRARRPEALARIGQVPDVEIRDLRALDGDDPEELAGAHRPCVAGASRDDEPLDEGALAARVAEPGIELAVHFQRRAGLGLIDHVRPRH